MTVTSLPLPEMEPIPDGIARFHGNEGGGRDCQQYRNAISLRNGIFLLAMLCLEGTASL